jgi:hypothetical protein
MHRTGKKEQMVVRVFQICAASLLLPILLCGCPAGDEFETVTTEDAEQAESHVDEHHHDHEAPHGGHLIELGDHQYNAEVVLEGDPKQLAVYLYDAHAENAVSIESQPLTFVPEEGEPISLEPQPQEGDAEGQSSRFVGSGAGVEGLSDLEALHGSLTVTIEGTEFTGNLEHAHDHEHEHEHEGEGAHDHEQ